jgi:hypothetical protein
MVLSLADQQRIEGLEYEISQLKDTLNKYKFQGSQGWVGNQTIQSGFLQSSNFVQSSSGFRLTADGIIYATGAVISGAITATSGTIGGWSINATSIYTGTEDHTGYTTNAGDMTFYSDGADASIHAFNWYIDTGGTFNARSGSIDGVTISGIPNSTATDISLLEKTHNLVFSVTDADTIAWASGTVNLSNGRTFSISAGNTGNMAALTYIYIDPAISTTVLQTTTTYSTAVGANKVLLGVAQNNTVTASFIPYGPGQALVDGSQIGALSIVAGNIAASTITAGKLTVSQLSAITADLGTITAGTVTGATLRTASSNPKFQMDSTSFQGIETSGNVVFEVVINGANAGDVIMGDDATGSYAMWDDSAGTFDVFADNVPTLSQGFFGGDGSDGALAITSGTTTLSAASAATLVKNYTSISITSTGKLAFSNPHTNGTTIILKSQGAVTLTATAPIIDASGMGAAGSAGGVKATGDGAGESNGGTGNAGLVSAPYKTNGGAGAAGGAGGTGGAAGSFNAIAVAYISNKYPYVIPGAGGGGGNAEKSIGTGIATGGTGGRGGGALIIECAGALNFTIASGITVAGAVGSNGATTAGTSTDVSAGGGGGGGGGSCAILYNTLTDSSGTIVVTGGGGGTTSAVASFTGEGGAGGGTVESAGTNGASGTANGATSGGAGAAGASSVALNTLFA